jgi:hypothetical protein
MTRPFDTSGVPVDTVICPGSTNSMQYPNFRRIVHTERKTARISAHYEVLKIDVE